MNVAGEVRAVRAELRSAASAARAAAQKAYLKSDLRFMGADQPAIRRVGTALARRVQAGHDAALGEVVEALWTHKVHELRSVAIAVLEQRHVALTSRDLPLLERMLRESRTWAYVDWISMKVLAPMLLRERRLRQRLPRWATDGDFWIRRAALLTVSPAVKRGDAPFSVFAVLAVPMLGEREFFIRKAIGWVLREVSKQNPAAVAAFLRAHRADVAGLTLREGAKYLPAKQRRALLGVS
jgi:3-methyladenine DNA glycosylase AlkD